MVKENTIMSELQQTDAYLLNRRDFNIFPLTRALLGGAFERPPLRFFEDSEKTAARSAAGFSLTLPPIFSATFVKMSAQGHVRLGHQVRSSDPTTK